MHGSMQEVEYIHYIAEQNLSVSLLLGLYRYLVVSKTHIPAQFVLTIKF
jgi:hypothetical protein